MDGSVDKPQAAQDAVNGAVAEKKPKSEKERT